MSYYTQNAENKTDKNLPYDKKPYRHYFCHKCSSSIEICVSCDRGQIYCKECSKIRKIERNKKANLRWRVSEKGKESRKKQNQRCYQRKKFPNFKGDRGSPLKNNSVDVPLLEKELAERNSDEDNFRNKSAQKKAVPQKECEEKINIFCAFCAKECAPFRRPSLPWRQVRKVWLGGRFYSKGGFK